MTNPVKAELFYDVEEEKIKLNWFCYEYANILYEKIMKSRKIAKHRKSRKENGIAQFCAHFSKAMKKSIDDRLSGITDVTEIDDEYVYAFYPGAEEAFADALISAGCEAWDELLSVCECCPVRCISERYARTDMFDRL
jgi:uncharacterized Fe-S radical SAM superfamily protein PflX